MVMENQDKEIIQYNQTSKLPDEETIALVTDTYSWLIRPCFIYNQEYGVCSSVKGRIHHYFVHGTSENCSPWKKDYNDCKLWKNNSDINAAYRIILHEQDRKKKRIDSFKNNDIWEHRKSPPANWNEPLPDFLQARYKGSFLSKVVDEFKGPWDHSRPTTGCVIL